ncbi:hypothetical protein BCR34DRAFT_504925 [Clohesyomyces aquaticus]|uniref:DUF6590 domain-containing protein n=1 Tax=Clohesyomyces aquaticus TaxID=1231657 RepID=A0A1Y2A6N3_9PLEO|nr:hypothetical protein BCR34DRAFT_504925 [Clohesyomyces aquaticus]
MASNNSQSWTWSSAHQDYYYSTTDEYGRIAYHFSKSPQSLQTAGQPATAQTVSAASRERSDSKVNQETYPDSAYATSSPYAIPSSYNPANPYGNSGTYQNSQSLYPNIQNHQQSHHVAYHNNTAAYQNIPTPYQSHSSTYNNDSTTQPQYLSPLQDNASYQAGYDPDQEMPQPLPANVRNTIPDLIPGTPQMGWKEKLAPEYQIRKGGEAYTFFKQGRVFAMLHAEAMGETQKPRLGDDCISVIKHGEYAYTNIRRFVIVQVMKGFVYACPISSYSGRGTTKPGCDPAEHAIVYCNGNGPVWLAGEAENAMRKDPIKVTTVNHETLSPASRIRFGKVYPIEMNVKVKEIGEVDAADRTKLDTYYREYFR